MTQEEKAKAYDEMVQRVKELHEAGNFLTKKQMEIICPELAESEDEKIRKCLSCLTSLDQSLDVIEDMDLTRQQLLAWLEKQKEQKPDEIDGKALLHVSNKSYDIGFRDGVASVKPADWSEEDEKIMQTMIKEGDLKPSEIAWLKSLLERFNLQPKQEWSEDDEMMVKSIVNVLKRFEHQGATDIKIDWLQNKLKSLLPQPHWKPSEEQMGALNALLCTGDFSYVGQATRLQELYNGLKKL